MAVDEGRPGDFGHARQRPGAKVRPLGLAAGRAEFREEMPRGRGPAGGSSTPAGSSAPVKGASSRLVGQVKLTHHQTLWTMDDVVVMIEQWEANQKAEL
jgi:hypothetical protein